MLKMQKIEDMRMRQKLLDLIEEEKTDEGLQTLRE
jgi:hypothetical protein